MSNDKDWAHLATTAKARRISLGLTQVELASKAPLSIDRIQAIEGNRTDRYSPRTLAALERGLDWIPGSVDAVLAREEPTSVGGQAFRPSPLGILIERARQLTSLKSWPEAEEAAIVDDWMELLRLHEPEGRDAAGLARMAHVVGLRPSEVESAGYADVARRMRKLLEGEGTARVVRPTTAYRDEATEEELENAYDNFEPGSLIRRVEELIRRRKERELDQALKLVEGQVDRDAG